MKELVTGHWSLVTGHCFLNQFKSLSFDGKSAKIAGLLREQLNKKGTPIGVYDLVLVTHNVTEFSRVHGLKYEDWEVV